MFKITDDLIKDISEPRFYSRGVQYYKQNMVKHVDVKKSSNYIFETKMRITAKVKSSFFEDYEVEVCIDEKEGIEEMYCSCDAFHSYCDYKHPCKHIVAVLLKYVHEIEKSRNVIPLSIPAQPGKASKIIAMLKSDSSIDASKIAPIKLDVKYTLETGYNSYSYIEFLIGERKTYVIRNIREFLTVIRDGREPHVFGKNFVYNPSRHYFKEDDKKLINFLMELYEINQNIDGHFYSYGNNKKIFSGKKLFLTDAQIPRFFELIKDKIITAQIGSSLYNDVSIIMDSLPLAFQLREDNDALLLSYKEGMPIPLTYFGTQFFYNGNIYCLDEKQRTAYIPIHNVFSSEGTDSEIAFTKSESAQIASYILPMLRNAGSTISIDKELESEFYEEPLIIQLYLDKIEDSIATEVKFNYGDISLNPLDDGSLKNSNGILIRNIPSEEIFITKLNSYGFINMGLKYILHSEDKIVDFLYHGVSQFQEICDVYYSESFKNIKLYRQSSYKSSIRLNDSDMLEFSFSIEGIDKKELVNIFNSIKSKKKYYKLKSGGFVSLEEKELREIVELVDTLDIKDNNLLKDKILISKHNSLFIDQYLKDNEISFVERNKKFREMVSNIRDVQELDFEVPKDLQSILRGYQKIGFKWMKTLATYGFGGILADEMGLGKTLQAISFLLSEVTENSTDKKPSLVVAPTSLVYNWQSEIERFAPKLKSVVISGPKSERGELLKEINDADIVITSYTLLRRDIDEYSTTDFGYFIIDEAQNIKNPNSQNAKCVKEIKAKAFFALTGTPLENSISDLWSIFDFIMPGYLYSQGKFVRRYETPIIKGKDTKVLEELNKRIRPFILRRLKAEVVTELPPKIEQRITVEMTQEQKEIYLAYLEATKNEINSQIESNGLEKSRIRVIAALTRLRQICCDPSTFIDNYGGESGKINALIDLLDEIISGGHRVLLFSQFTSTLKNIEKLLIKNEIGYKYLDGSTKSEDRMRLVNEFNSGDGSVFLISLKAGGTGLNLTGADVVIHFDPWWNPAAEDQATDRAHRIGQSKTVEVIKLITKGTIEEKIFNLQTKKKALIKNIIDNNETSTSLISNMTKEEIEELLSVK